MISEFRQLCRGAANPIIVSEQPPLPPDALAARRESDNRRFELIHSADEVNEDAIMAEETASACSAGSARLSTAGSVEVSSACG